MLKTQEMLSPLSSTHKTHKPIRKSHYHYAEAETPSGQENFQKNLPHCISCIPGTKLGFAPLTAPASQGHIRLLARAPGTQFPALRRKN